MVNGDELNDEPLWWLVSMETDDWLETKTKNTCDWWRQTECP